MLPKLSLILSNNDDDERLVKVDEVIQLGHVSYAVIKDGYNVSFCRVETTHDGIETLTDDLTDEEYSQVKCIYEASKKT